MNGFEEVYLKLIEKFGISAIDSKKWHEAREKYKEQVGEERYYLEAVESDLFGKLSLSDGMKAIVLLFKQFRKEKLEIEQRLDAIENRIR